MAAMNNLDWNIRWRTRDCEVDGRYGHFHMWEQYSEVIPPSPLIGGHSGGVVAGVFGIVEFEAGVERVDPTKISFTDQEHAEISEVNKVIRAFKENSHD